MSDTAQQSITLSQYDWHCLLRDMEEHMRIINRDQSTLIRLYESIASQLAGQPVRVERPEPPRPRSEPLPPPMPPAKPWYRRIFLRSTP